MRLFAALIVYFSLATAALSYPAPYTCSRNFYVSTAGVDQAGCGGNGSSVPAGASMCATILGANNNIALQAGDCVNVGAGTYGTTTTITLTKGGSSNQPNGYVTYIGAANNTSVIQWNADSFSGLLLNAPYIIIDGFDFNGNNILSSNVLGGYPLANNIQQNLNTPVHHFMIINNIIRNTRASGFGTVGGDYMIFAGNLIHDTATCSNFGQSAVHIKWATALPGFNATLPWDTQFYHIQILDNISHDNGWRGVNPAGLPNYTNCIPNDDGSGLNTDNFQLQNWSTGGPAPNPGPYPFHTLYAGNLAYNNGSRGLNANSANNIDFYNNTTFNNGLNNDTRNAAQTAPVPPHTAAVNCEILVGGVFNLRNNIMYGSTTTAETATLCWLGAYGFAENGTVQNNDFYNGSASSGISMQGTQNDTANLASITNPGSNNLLAINPLVNSLVNFDFHLQTNSPCAGKGSPIPTSVLPNAVATNDCQAFTSPPNMGAFNGGVATVVNTVPGPVSVVAGGPAAAPFVADAGANGGTVAGPCACGTIDTSLLLNPVPQGALNFQRYGNFNYIVSGLTAGHNYEDVLYFTEDIDTTVGQRTENVLINGQQVLTNFDIFAATGVQHKAVSKSFFSAADGNGNITLQFNGVAGNFDVNAKVDSFQVLSTVAGPVSISPGGTAAAPFIADDGFSGGLPNGPGGWTTDLSGLSNPPPASIFQFQRYGPSFYYVVNSLNPGQTYTVNLFFSEDYPPDNSANQRLMNVTLNGSTSLVNFDIFTTAGALHKAVLKSFPIIADAQGVITALFQVAPGSVDPNAKVNGIQVLTNVGNPPVAQNQTASTPFNTPVMINLGNGATNSPTSATIVGTPAGGNVALNGLTATFTPTAGFSGTGSFNFTLTNSNGVSNTAMATIAVAGPIIIPPVAIAKSVSTQFQTPVTINLSSNAVNNPTSATIQTNPTNGTVVISSIFNATYTPNTGFSGQDSFTFTLANGGGTSNTATVTVVVNPQVLTTCP